MVTTSQKLTASETVLLAAADLAAAGKHEFSEWDLTVAAWALDRFRFGLRGYAQSYPDHKRVMMEIMGQKASSPVQQKYLEKLRPNFYRLTPLGKAAAARIRAGGDSSPVKPASKPAAKPVTIKEMYEAVAAYVGRQEFRRWEDNPEEPRDWAGAASFLGLAGKDARIDPADRLEEVRSAIQDAIDWCKVQEIPFLTRGSGQGGAPIHVRDLANMLDFLVALTYRFPDKLEKRGGSAAANKPKKRFTE
jgi:hypothetical protein